MHLSLTGILQLVLVMVLVASALTSLGLVVASMMTSMEGFQVVMNFLVLPMWLLSGAFFPLRGLPAWMAVLTRVDPRTYAVDALRGVVYAGSPQARVLVAHTYELNLGVIAVVLVASFALALGTFRSRED